MEKEAVPFIFSRGTAAFLRATDNVRGIFPEDGLMLGSLTKHCVANVERKHTPGHPVGINFQFRGCEVPGHKNTRRKMYPVLECACSAFACASDNPFKCSAKCSCT